MEGNGFAPVRNYTEFSPDVGPPSRRQRSTLAQHIIPWNFHFTADEVDDFLDFFHADIADGAGAFDAPDPFKGDVAEFVFEGDHSLTQLSANVFRLTSAIRRIS